MQIDDKSRQAADEPKRWEAFSTGSGGLPPMPPSAANIKDIGPLSDQPTGQAARDAAAYNEPQERSLSPLQASTRRFGRNKRAMVSLGIIVLMVLISFLGPFIYLHIGPTLLGGPSGTKPEGPEIYHVYTHQELIFTDRPPSAQYPLGTDNLGRDILARLMAGVNVSIEVALLVLVFDIGLGLLIGTLAGFFGGWIDAFLARFTDLAFAFPVLLFAILAAATLGPAFTDRFGGPGRLILVGLALGLTIWPQMARYVRGQTLQLKEQQFVEAARTVGGTDKTIILRHIVPNLFNIVMTAATLDIVGIIIGEATISLLGLGVQPPGSSLGLMISDGSITLTFAPWEVLIPTFTLAILVLCFSFVGDGINEAFDPRSKD